MQLRKYDFSVEQVKYGQTDDGRRKNYATLLVFFQKITRTNFIQYTMEAEYHKMTAITFRAISPDNNLERMLKRVVSRE